MSCYDSVLLYCPECAAPQYAQSKSGPCEMHTYKSLTEAPINVILGINRHAPFVCTQCQTKFKVDTQLFHVSSVVKVDSYESV